MIGKSDTKVPSTGNIVPPCKSREFKDLYLLHRLTLPIPILFYTRKNEFNTEEKRNNSNIFFRLI